MPVRLSKWCNVKVFVLTVCKPSNPGDGDNFEETSFNENSMPNLTNDDDKREKVTNS